MAKDRDKETGRRGDGAQLPEPEDQKVTRSLEPLPPIDPPPKDEGLDPSRLEGLLSQPLISNPSIDISKPVRAIEGGDGPNAAPPSPQPTRVRVVCEGVLGPRLLKKGDVTSDPQYVALLTDKRRLVVPA